VKILSAINDDILRPIRAFRPAYLPLLMVYFAYGALGLIDVSRDMWIKESLTLNPAELASISVWLALPWTVKMVFGEMVDRTWRAAGAVDRAVWRRDSSAGWSAMKGATAPR
jgi:hypothetical protein